MLIHKIPETSGDYEQRIDEAIKYVKSYIKTARYCRIDHSIGYTGEMGAASYHYDDVTVFPLEIGELKAPDYHTKESFYNLLCEVYNTTFWTKYEEELSISLRYKDDEFWIEVI